MGGNLEGLTVIVPQFPVFKEKEKVLLFINQLENVIPKNKRFSVVGLKQGKFSIDKKRNKIYRGTNEFPLRIELLNRILEDNSMDAFSFLNTLKNLIKHYKN